MEWMSSSSLPYSNDQAPLFLRAPTSEKTNMTCILLAFDYQSAQRLQIFYQPRDYRLTLVRCFPRPKYIDLSTYQFTNSHNDSPCPQKQSSSTTSPANLPPDPGLPIPGKVIPLPPQKRSASILPYISLSLYLI